MLKANEVRFVTPHFNPLGFRRQRETYYEWVETLPSFVRDNLLCYELVFDDKEPEIKDSIVIRGTPDLHFMWQKEALINRALKDAPEFRYFAWLDHDMVIHDHDWVKDAILKLRRERKRFCQLFKTVAYLLPNGKPERVQTNMQVLLKGGNPGGLWLADRDYLDYLGGLPNCNIVGAGDRVFFFGICPNDLFAKGKFYNYYKTGLPYTKAVRDWFINTRLKNRGRDVTTYLDRDISHLYHGKLSNRQYHTREDRLAKLNFDPAHDVKVNKDGLLEFTNRNMKVQTWIKEYFSDRKEDE